MNRRMQIFLIVLLVIASIFFLVRQKAPDVSTDSLSMGLADRWGGGLPSGYTAEAADDLETAGYQYACLTYEEDISSQLSAWSAAGDAEVSAFEELLTAHLAAEQLPEEHRELLESCSITPDETWLAFLGQDEENPDEKIVLLYDPEGLQLYLEERLPPES